MLGAVGEFRTSFWVPISLGCTCDIDSNDPYSCAFPSSTPFLQSPQGSGLCQRGVSLGLPSSCQISSPGLSHPTCASSWLPLLFVSTCCSWSCSNKPHCSPQQYFMLQIKDTLRSRFVVPAPDAQRNSEDCMTFGPTMRLHCSPDAVWSRRCPLEWLHQNVWR